MDIEEAKKELKHVVNFKNNTGFAYSRKNTIILQQAIETVLQELDNSISKDQVKEKLEIAKKEYQKNLNSIDRKISHTKDEHKIRSIYADFGVKRGRLKMLEELLEDK